MTTVTCIIFLGPPGSGKGTQAEIISKKLKLKHISTGEIFRKHIASHTSVGKMIKKYVQEGKLVPDDIVFTAVKSVLSKTKRFLLDGFPRNIVQAKLLEQYLNKLAKTNCYKKIKVVRKVIYFSITDKEVIKRLTSRRTCPKCGKNYNLYTLKPKEDELCDICKIKLTTREDDKLSTVKKRLEIYKKDTKPLIKFYTQKQLKSEPILYKIDANKPVEKVTDMIYELLRKI